MKKRITSIILAITLIFTIFSAVTITASAEENVVYGDYMYTDLDDGTVIIDGYEGFDDDIIIPSTLKGKTVSAIGGYVFNGAVCNSIEIPASITLIESDAFYDFNDVAEFKVAADNEHYCAVGGVLFTKDMTQLVKYPAKKSADSYEIPDGVEYVCDYAFQKSNLLETVIIPNTVETLGFGSFEQCENLASVTIPESVKTVGNNAFGECTALVELIISDGVQTLESYAFK
ncbi:MAG: leucine-rich repeat domain-containing protein, partial [Acutalibacteraceae bacterium]